MATYYVDGALGNDSNAGTSAGSGNAWLTIGKAVTTMVGGDETWVKNSATYTLTGATLVLGGSRGLYGYGTTIGDSGVVVVDASGMTASNDTFSMGDHDSMTNIKVTGSRRDAFTCVSQTSLVSCHAVSPLRYGINGVQNCTRCTVDGAAGWGITAAIARGIQRCVVKGSTANGGINGPANGCLVYNCTGIGIECDSEAISAIGNTVYNSTSHGIRVVNRAACLGNISYGNGGYGFSGSSSLGGNSGYGWNAAGNNTSGATTAWPATTTGPLVALTVNPFTNVATGDFTLNNAAGGGALCKGAGFPVGVFP